MMAYASGNLGGATCGKAITKRLTVLATEKRCELVWCAWAGSSHSLTVIFDSQVERVLNFDGPLIDAPGPIDSFSDDLNN